MQGVNEKRLPTRPEAVWFEFRAACFRVKRGLQELNGRAPKRLRRLALATDSHLVAESRTVLYNSASPAEFALQAGKVQNLRVSARHLNGTIIRAGEVFSLWKNLGRATRASRICCWARTARRLCYSEHRRRIMPAVERPLRRRLASRLRDCRAPFAYPGASRIDHRAGARCDHFLELCRFSVSAENGLPAAGRAESRRTHGWPRESFSGVFPPPESIVPAAASCETRLEVAETCETCGVIQCFRNPAASSLPRRGITAFLLDKFEPEFDRWVGKNRDHGDIALVPLSSKRFRAYRWTRKSSPAFFNRPLTTLRRSWMSRRLAAQGAARQRALLEFDRALALDFSRRIPHVADHLVVSQNLLPHLWRNGDLGGRTFDVLMTRLPIAELEKVLDTAEKMFPESRTLADFRSRPEIRDAEAEALDGRAIMDHAAFRRSHNLAGDRAVKLDWEVPPTPPRNRDRRSVAFSGKHIGAQRLL